MPDSIKKLQDLFSKFPTIGSRTAGRFVSYILKLSKKEIDELMVAISEVKKNVKLCGFCFNPYEGQGDLCLICQNNSRNKQLLCIVEKESDLATIEKSNKYRGRYFILGGVVGLRKKEADLRLSELKDRIKKSSLAEIIIAINPTPEGIATISLVEQAIKEMGSGNLTITHLGRGLPFGGELEYADEDTIQSAFEGRK